MAVRDLKAARRGRGGGGRHVAAARATCAAWELAWISRRERLVSVAAADLSIASAESGRSFELARVSEESRHFPRGLILCALIARDDIRLVAR